MWLEVPAAMNDLKIGDSLAVDGVCLTVEEKKPGRQAVLAFQLGQTTVKESDLGQLRAGQAVNLEKPVTLNQPLGGHLVSGHIDSVVKIIRIIRGQGGYSWEIELPEKLAKYVAVKGSLALNGVSLTVAGLGRKSFSVFLIPQTLKATNLGQKKIGGRLNLETDLLAKYLERQAGVKLPQTAGSGKIIDLDLLKQAGF